MNQQTLVTVIAHGNGIAAFRRHLPLWEAHQCPILVICPEDDPVESDHETIRFAKAEHNGRESHLRLQFMLEHLLLQDYQRYVIFEYDSFCLSPELPRPQRGFCGNIYGNAESNRFLAPRYANPPWIVDAGSLALMHTAVEFWPDVFEEGEADRYLAAIAGLASVPILPHDPVGYSRGDITERHITELRASIYAGATMIHGIKREWTFRAALQFYDERHIV